MSRGVLFEQGPARKAANPARCSVAGILGTADSVTLCCFGYFQMIDFNPEVPVALHVSQAFRVHWLNSSRSEMCDLTNAFSTFQGRCSSFKRFRFG